MKSDENAGVTISYRQMSATARITLTRTQCAAIIVIAVAGLAGGVFLPTLAAFLVLAIQISFLSLSAWRMGLIAIQIGAPRADVPPLAWAGEWPRYTIVAALYHEADILPYLVERLEAIDYPRDRLQGFLALEADDHATITAASQLELPQWLSVLVVPPGAPKTKPRALNYALARATGDFLTIYDAEDDPDPLQLKEAAMKFRAEGEALACLQAPLRIRSRRKTSPHPLLDRQFAAEYAALFEITLPAMARLGLPFPLGGTSNHFRVSVLRSLGGWDAWNVTEDADLGFRIWRAGYRLGVISRPTYETPPGPVRLWLPQRTRWLKGYLQTLAVHTRSASGMGWRGWAALVLTVGAGLGSAAVHAGCMAWVAVVCLMAAIEGRLPALSIMGWAVLIIGLATAWSIQWRGARLAGARYGPLDMAASLPYWFLLSLAFSHAAVRLALEPHHWDKTPHREDVEPIIVPDLYPDAGRTAA